MATLNLMPIAGINNVKHDDDLWQRGDEAKLFVRDAVNINITPAGKPEMRDQISQVSSKPFANLWNSPLHGDTFATLGDKWVLVNVPGWQEEELASIGEGDVSHTALNNQVCVAGPEGIFSFNGLKAVRLTIPTPSPPMVSIEAGGSLVGGTYGIAITWLRDEMVSAPSSIASMVVPDGGSLNILFPACFDSTVTDVRLFITKPDGGMLGRAGDYPIATTQVSLPLLPQIGAAPEYRHCSPMPTGRFLSYWRGRLMTAKANVINFSEAMAYHIHDARHGFVQMPQRITFMEPVDGGIWVGQVDHVAFLQGTDIRELSLRKKTARAPVPGSSVALDADTSGQYDQGGMATVAWLADNGYVVGTSDGQMIENSAGTLQGISASAGTSVGIGERLITVVT